MIKILFIALGGLLLVGSLLLLIARNVGKN